MHERYSIDTKCPRQKAFILRLNYLLAVRDDVYWRNEEDLRDHYEKTYEEFVNLWCPTLKDEYLPTENIGCDPSETDLTGKYFQWTYPKMEPIPNCCSTPERQEQYEELVRLKNYGPHIPVPSPSDYYINPDPTKE